MLGKRPRRRMFHRGPRHVDFDQHNEGEGSQMPSSSQTSCNDFPRSPPRAPRAMREKSRSPTPLPPQMPSTSYIASAEQEPSRLEDPSSLRKLLVLDLNGTLLHRSANNTRAKPYERTYDARGYVNPRLRPVHPRPYMPAFRKYLFSPETKTWLDVMVWSSAQPHSVEDMVNRCFGADQKKMVAIWARDTLGLTSAQYQRKVQTIKNLEKPWSLLAPQTTNPPSPHSSIASTPPTSPLLSSQPRPSGSSSTDISPPSHSALSTLLLDDSPRKAELQPFNHVCIGEYSGELHAKDVDNLQKEHDWLAAVKARQRLEAAMAEDKESSASAVDPANIPLPEDPDDAASSPDEARPSNSNGDSSKKRKRKDKKLQQRAARLEELTAQGEPQVSYDETLLAVIGVLDEIKTQANVAAWIRSGGLWGPRGPPPSARSSDLQTGGVSDLPPSVSVAVEEDGASHSDDSTLSVGKGKPAIDANGAEKAAKRNKKRRRLRGSSAEGEVGEAESKGKADEKAPAGNDEATTARSSTTIDKTVNEGTTEEDQGMWFQDPEVVAYWTARGRRALEALEIPIEHGVEH